MSVCSYISKDRLKLKNPWPWPSKASRRQKFFFFDDFFENSYEPSKGTTRSPVPCRISIGGKPGWIARMRCASLAKLGFGKRSSPKPLFEVSSTGLKRMRAFGAALIPVSSPGSSKPGRMAAEAMACAPPEPPMPTILPGLMPSSTAFMRIQRIALRASAMASIGPVPWRTFTR